MDIVPANIDTVVSKILARFGSLPRLLSADDDELADLHVPQGVCDMLGFVRAALFRALRHELLERPLFPSDEAVLSYLHGAMAHLPRETFRVLFLDSGNRLIQDRVMWEGTTARVQIHPREVIRTALHCDATAMIVAHNHPSGDSQPSRFDIDITRKLDVAAKSFDIVLHDHLIISRSGWCSLRADGWLRTAQSPQHHANERAHAA